MLLLRYAFFHFWVRKHKSFHLETSPFSWRIEQLQCHCCVFFRENITFKKMSIGRFVERHLLIEWCLKPSKKYISTKTLYNLIYALVQFFWNRPTDPMGFSFKHMFDHQALEEWVFCCLLPQNILPSCCTKPHLPEPDRPISLRKNDWIKALLNHDLRWGCL